MPIRAWGQSIVCAGVLMACKADEPVSASAPASPAAREPAPATIAEPSFTPLPDCVGVDTTLPKSEKPLSPVAKARREPVHLQFVAKVGDVEIPRSALESIFAMKVEKYTSRDRVPPQSTADRYQASIASRLVGQEILRQEMAARGLPDDDAAVAKMANAQRRGIADYGEHLRRRAETEQTMREMNLSYMREEVIGVAVAAPEIGDAQLLAAYCRDRAKWPADREYRVISHLMFPTKDAAAEAVAKLERGTGITELAASQPDRPFVAHDLVAPDENAFSKATFAAPVGRATLVEVGVESMFFVVVVERSVPSGSLSRELVFDAVREGVRQHEIGRQRAALWSSLLEKYPVTLFGVPEERDTAEPSAPD